MADYMGELSRLSELTRFAELTRFLYVLSIILTFRLPMQSELSRLAGTAAVTCRVNSLSRCHSGFGPPGPYQLADSDPYGTYPLADMYPLPRNWTP